MRNQHVLDLAWPDLEARSDNHVLGAVDDIEPTIGVAPADFARAQPTVDEVFGCRLRLVPISPPDLRPTGEQFAEVRVLPVEPAVRPRNRNTDGQGTRGRIDRSPLPHRHNMR